MIAQFGMYDWPEVRDDLRSFWSEVVDVARGADIQLPHDLTHDVPLVETWQRPDMALSMCCGWHLLTGAIGDAKVLAQPVWDQPNHEAGTYHSKIVCRREDAHMPLDALASEPVVNGRDSWSGFQTFLRWAAGEGIILGPVQISGGHRNSLTFLREGRGRLATIDSVCWRLAEFVGETDGLTVLGETATQPCPPVIMGAARQSQNVALLEVLQAACHSACAKPWMDAIGLIGFRPALRETYLQMLRT